MKTSDWIQYVVIGVAAVSTACSSPGIEEDVGRVTSAQTAPDATAPPDTGSPAPPRAPDAGAPADAATAMDASAPDAADAAHTGDAANADGGCDPADMVPAQIIMTSVSNLWAANDAGGDASACYVPAPHVALVGDGGLGGDQWWEGGATGATLGMPGTVAISVGSFCPDAINNCTNQCATGGGYSLNPFNPNNCWSQTSCIASCLGVDPSLIAQLFAQWLTTPPNAQNWAAGCAQALNGVIQGAIPGAGMPMPNGAPPSDPSN